MVAVQPNLTLPGVAYTDSGVYQSELVHIYGKTWQYICHIERLRNPGDFLVLEIGGESVFVICGDDHKVRGFFNVCAHRGSRLLEASGCSRRISCPYHSWTYDSAGRLVAAPNSNHVKGFNKSQYRLSEFNVTVVNGLVFANLDESAPAFGEFAPGLGDELSRYAPDLPDLTFVHRTEDVIKGNWKIAVENFAECYHCALLHPDLVNNIIDLKTYRVRIHRHWHKHETDNDTARNRIYNFESEKEPGREKFIALWMWPNFAFQNYPGGAVHVWKWQPVDVNSTHVTVDWFFRSSELRDWEKQLIDHHAANTFAEDLPIIEKVHKGQTSAHYKPGPLMIDDAQSELSEHGVWDIQQYWRNAMCEVVPLPNSA